MDTVLVTGANTGHVIRGTKRLHRKAPLPTHLGVGRGQGSNRPYCDCMDPRVLGTADEPSNRCALPHEVANPRAGGYADA